ncbi:hypothetical protein FK498_01130 [Elioraea sp. Yellowstone]|jgi:hypothetical protein|uniref:hypothetical protein n=1 Tax=Elioraea sp. Yellowstone TaxID=2592070 RepID=UPI0011523CC1|nr:hypothetical protein [Elioraea sp. Yellowstone]TQF84818.1 hypothetical protein FK498_01130 [Elioraea sp. Yellowstone]
MRRMVVCRWRIAARPKHLDIEDHPILSAVAGAVTAYDAREIDTFTPDAILHRLVPAMERSCARAREPCGVPIATSTAMITAREERR